MASEFGLAEHPVLIHGVRRVLPSKREAFVRAFCRHAADAISREGSTVKAIFAFPAEGEPCAYHHVMWSRGGVGVLPEAGSELESAYVNDSHDVLNVYGEGLEGGPSLVAAFNGVSSNVRYNFLAPRAGFIKSRGARVNGPPLFGFFRRRVKPGRMQALLESFDAVCDIWRTQVPGCLCACVTQDPDDPENFVHDLRIFADMASYAAHVDKSNLELSDRIARWFQNYDTTTPFSGALYGAGFDAAQRKSSVEATEDAPSPEMSFAQFDYRDAGMLGEVPDMDRHDEECNIEDPCST